MQRTKIPYIQFSWNPVVMRCTRVSAGCDRCWHLAMAARHAWNPMFSPEVRAARGGGKPWLDEAELDAPLRHKKPSRVAVNFMGDIAHESIRAIGNCKVWYEAIWRVMAQCPQHTFLLLTKRPEGLHHAYGDAFLAGCGVEFPLPNVWLGVSIEDQATADARIPVLLQIPAAVRFISAEPMLGEVSLESYFSLYAGPGAAFKARVDWTICGAETGPGARPMNLGWARNLLAQCRAAGIPFWMKAVSKGAILPPDLDIHELPGGAA